MAKIKGFEVKAVKTFMGREGYGLNANLYYKNKKVGEVIDDASGGPMKLDIEDKEVDEIFNEVANERSDYNFEQYADFVNELVEMKELESMYKKSVKNGYGKMVVLKDDVITEEGIMGKEPVVYSVTKDYDVDGINMRGYKYMDVYDDLEDFNIAKN